VGQQAPVAILTTGPGPSMSMSAQGVNLELAHWLQSSAWSGIASPDSSGLSSPLRACK